MNGQNNECFVGIQSIPDSANQYRLGTIFLRNFYTALDFDNNLILIGVNKGSSLDNRAKIRGKIDNPVNPPSKPNSYWWVIILIFILAFVVAVAFFVHQSNQHKKARDSLREVFTEDKNIPGLVDK